jgi:hypothetical protein
MTSDIQNPHISTCDHMIPAPEDACMWASGQPNTPLCILHLLNLADSGPISAGQLVGGEE